MLRPTKFHRPAVPQDIVLRPRLLDKLGQGMSRPLTLVCAPAGYGKTILVSSYLQTCAVPWAWLSLDENDDDLRVFLDYVLAALDALFPGALRHTQSLLAGASLPPVSVIADSLVNELAAIERDFIMVLDDLHVIGAADIYALLAALLRHPLPKFHLLLLTRQDPPLALGTLRAYDRLTEIRGRDLRFTAGETAAFMDRAVAIPLCDETLALLTERTEGWAVGLRLAALILRDGGDASNQIAHLHAENSYVMDYLVSHVLSRLPPSLEEFLIKTSILDTLCGPLCDAVTAPEGAVPSGQSNLARLEKLNLFTTSLDDEQVWYRYHHLFHVLLRNRLANTLDAKGIAVLHLRASAWYENEGRIDEALRHALAASDVQGAAQLVAKHRHDLLNNEDRPRLARWLRAFPETALNQFPDLLLATAWTARPGRANSRRMMAWVNQAQELVSKMAHEPEHARRLQGEIDTLRVIENGLAANDPESVIAHATRALETMPREWYLARSSAWLHLALAYQMSGQLEHCYAVLASGAQEEAGANGSMRVRTVGSRAFVHWIAADLLSVLDTATFLASVCQATNLHESYNWACYFLALASYQRNDLAAAERYACAVQEQRYLSDPLTVAQSAFILAAIHQAHGSAELAHMTLERTSDYLHEMRSEALLPHIQAFRAELAARQGDLDMAGHWAMTAGPRLPLGAMGLFYAPQLALPKILLAMNTPASREQAATEISRLHSFVTATHNTCFTIDVLALQALLQQAQGNVQSAVAILAQALSLAQPGGFIRKFVDLGPAMAHLLACLPQDHAAAGYVRQILRAFAPLPAVPLLPSKQANLVELLTNREVEVLELLAQRLSAKEIAQHLIISERTVKRHTANIYQKLAVNNRRSAVALATALGALRV